MSAKINIQPYEVWQYYNSHKKDCGTTQFELASNDEYGVKIYLSENDNGVGCIFVEADDCEIYKEVIVSETDASRTASKIYDEYLTNQFVNTVSSELDTYDDELAEEEVELRIDAREEEIDQAVALFIEEVCPGTADADMTGELLNDVKEHFLEYLYLKHGLDIYRPMMLEDDDGEVFFEEYPYGSMEIESADNPLYK